MNRFESLSSDELETLIDALMFDRLDEYGLSEKLMHEIMDARKEKMMEVKQT